MPTPIPVTPRSVIPAPLAEPGWEVLERVPRPERGALEAYRLAANALSRMLRVGGGRVKPKDPYYTGLRLKWMADNPTD